MSLRRKLRKQKEMAAVTQTDFSVTETQIRGEGDLGIMIG